MDSAAFAEDSRIRSWLRPADASVNYTSALKTRYADTGRWFLDSHAYEALRTTSDTHLWLRGIPGSGKTVLASTIIEDLRNGDGKFSDSAVIFFFFSFNDESKRKVDHMLRSLIYQLAGQHESTKPRLMKTYKDHKDGTEQPLTKTLMNLFVWMLGQLKNVTIVLDALDESVEKHDLLQWLKTLSSGHRCNFVLTSRSERELDDSLTLWLPSNHIITLENESIGEDIEAYVRYNLSTRDNLSRWVSIHDLISDALVEKAGGMSVYPASFHTRKGSH